MEHEQLNSSKSILPLGSISEILNMMFKPGDRLQLYAGAEPYKESGSFLATTDDVLVWVDSNNNVSFQYIGGILGIRKIGSSESDSSESENEAEENQGSSQNMSVKRESKTEDKASSEEMPLHSKPGWWSRNGHGDIRCQHTCRQGRRLPAPHCRSGRPQSCHPPFSGT